MQLATSQRPHPPPVPPRPSRQVVAEALKRSPRPPCPTRQAPPPPNTRPWRSEERETVSGPGRGGRTVVYESIKELQNGEQIRSSSEPPITTNQTPKSGSVSPRRRSNEEAGNIIGQSKSGNNIGVGKTSSVTDKIEEHCGRTKPATSERNEVENHRERQNAPQQHHHAQQPQRRSNGNDLCDWKNSIARLSENNADIHSRTEKKSSISYDDKIINEEPENIENNMLEGKREYFRRELVVEKILEDEKKTLKNNNFRTSFDDDITKNYEQENPRQLDVFTYENIAKSIEGSTDTHNDSSTIPETSFSPFANKPGDQKETRNDTRVPNTPTKNETKRESVNNEQSIDAREDEEEENEEPIERLEEEECALKSGSTTTISSDDGATVVVIDEPERKIAFNEDNDNIHHQDWLEAGVRYSSTKITLPGEDPVDRNDEIQHLDNDDDYDNLDENEDEGQSYAELDFSSIRERIAMSSLQGLPPLPRSLSGFNLNEGRREAGEPPPPPARSSSRTPKNVKSTQPSSSRPSPPGRQLTTLDTQLAILRKEMFGLRQLDLSLLSQLWSLNESIQEFRQLLQEQEDRAPSPSPSSEEGDDTSYGSHPPPPPRRPAPLLHHHRPPRPPRSLRPSASDESPSSEEYGAV